jgi:hypothetical protein
MKMKFNFDVPVGYLNHFYKSQDFLMCNAFMCQENTVYCNFFKDKSKEKHVILDTTTFNINQTMSLSDLINLADYVGAREIIAPYLFYNVERTLDQINMLYRYLDSKSLMSKFNILVVPQGNTLQDYLHNLTKFLRFPTDTIVIPANVFSVENTYRTEQLRFNLVQKLAKDKLLGKKTIHLLELCGLQFLKAYTKGQRFFKIRSLNTAYPVSLGVWGKTFDKTKKNLRVPPNFYSLSLQPNTLERIKKNITYFKEYR